MCDLIVNQVRSAEGRTLTALEMILHSILQRDNLNIRGIQV